jgi:DNA-binding CsgD family transcriptional regulator
MQHLRPLERRVLSMAAEGVEIDEIAKRIRKTPDRVESIIAWTDIPRTRPAIRRSPTPVESRVLALLAAGESHERIGRRLHRSARYVRQVEGLAYYRQGTEILRRPRDEVTA